MPVSAERITADINAIAQFTQTPGAGTTRPTFSVPWRAARDYVAAQAESIGCHTRIDAAGNLHARPGAISWEAPAWVSGSHLDTLRNAGNYDGVVGVVAALEVLRAAREDLKMACPMELVVWAGSENALFGESWIGSRAYAGEIAADKLVLFKSPQGQTYLEAGAAHGVSSDALTGDAGRLATLIGYIEVHVEESAGLWEQGIGVAAVNAMGGRRQYLCDFATPAEIISNPLLAAAEGVLALERLAHDLQSSAAISVSQIECQPNLVGSRVKRATLGVELRSSEMTAIAMADQLIRRALEKIAQARKVNPTISVIASQTVIELDKRICAKMSKSAQTLRIDPLSQTVSGVMHDAIVLCSRIPAAMIFVASRDGITHSPDEFARPEDIAQATALLMETVRDRRLE